MSRYLFTYIIACLILQTGCMPYGHDIATEVTRISEATFPPTEGPIEVYFGESVPQREHAQIAFLEVVGKKYSSTDTLLAHMRAQAQKLGAHAVISIKKMYFGRETGDLLVDLLSIGDDEHENEVYDAPVLTGIAIRYYGEE